MIIHYTGRPNEVVTTLDGQRAHVNGHRKAYTTIRDVKASLTRVYENGILVRNINDQELFDQESWDDELRQIVAYVQTAQQPTVRKHCGREVCFCSRRNCNDPKSVYPSFVTDERAWLAAVKEVNKVAPKMETTHKFPHRGTESKGPK